MERYLRSTDIIDWKYPAVMALASQLRAGASDPVAIARRAFEWVRDEIKHSVDHGLSPVTCTASEVLSVGSGYCYAKSHLLAALLRANGIAAGLCYQRLAGDDTGGWFCLHGLNAVLLPGIGWYRVDARGNREGNDAQFSPPVEHLAFEPGLPGEADLPEIWADPLPVVVETLRSCATAQEVGERLPDVLLIRGGLRDLGSWGIEGLGVLGS
ncbi:MAG: transglutaminase family protein [Acidobacteria bacterium]|nr:transglutaminase family protein [Acidobacteriota bacterium]